MKLGNPTPVIRIFDEEKAREFYVEYLEFRIDWEHRFAVNMPLYMQISNSGCVLHLSAHHGDGTPGTKVRIECDDLIAYHAELKAKNYKFLNPGVGKQPWAEAEMCLADPFGNKLIYSR